MSTTAETRRLWEEVIRTTPCDCPLCNPPRDRRTRHRHARGHATAGTRQCRRWRRALELLDKKPGDSVNHPAE